MSKMKRKGSRLLSLPDPGNLNFTTFGTRYSMLTSPIHNPVLPPIKPLSKTSSVSSLMVSYQYLLCSQSESLFSNSSSSERKYWGFSVLLKALPLVPAAQLPLLFTPNVMRSWTNNLASSDRYLHQIAISLAKQIQDSVKANPSVGFTLLSALVGKGRTDFDKATKTKTVEGILHSLSVDGVKEYIAFLQNIVLGTEEKNGYVENMIP